MFTHEAVAPPFAEDRQSKVMLPGAFHPAYDNLVDLLADPTVAHPDRRVAHVLATLSAYAYSDDQTVAMIAARLGLAGNRCLRISQDVDAMFICSNAYLVQSRCGRVAILCYRGTQPANFINWLTDADISPERITFPEGAPAPGSAEAAMEIHGGFYRNVRSTRFAVVEALDRAFAGNSILTGDDPGLHEHDSKILPLEALYVTGHSLGAAMAAILATMVVQEKKFAPIAAKLRAVYTYGQPMIGNPALARECAKNEFLARRLFRYVYGHDVVPEFPPTASGPFEHFGREFRYGGHQWVESSEPTRQMRNLLGLPGAVAAFVAHQFRATRSLPFPHSLYDHEPQHYIAKLTPPGVHSEFGD